jgi:predicted HicB family RNase H-like nuclease
LGVKIFDQSYLLKRYQAARGEEPEKPYSGKFVVRVEPELHMRLAIEARKRGVSINALVGEALSKTIDETTQQGQAH